MSESLEAGQSGHITPCPTPAPTPTPAAPSIPNTLITSIGTGGYAEHQLPHLKLSLLSLNTIIYAVEHFTRYEKYYTPQQLTDMDPMGQFEWLEATLANCSNRGDGWRVYITGHIAPVLTSFSFNPLWEKQFATRYVNMNITDYFSSCTKSCHES